MAADVTEVARDAQEKIIDSVEALQTTVLRSARALGEIVETIVPAQLRNVEVPGTSALPSPEQSLSLGFDFVERVLASQRKFLAELSSIPLSNVAAPATAKKTGASSASK